MARAERQSSAGRIDSALIIVIAVRSPFCGRQEGRRARPMGRHGFDAAPSRVVSLLPALQVGVLGVDVSFEGALMPNPDTQAFIRV